MRDLTLFKAEQHKRSRAASDERCLDLFGPAASLLSSRLQESTPEAVLVASGRTREGATTTVLGLAHTLHQRYGARVMVVELNFSRPVLGELFSAEEGKSLAEIAAGGVTALKACTQVDEGLSILPAGVVDAGLRRSIPRVLRQVLDESAGRFDMVLVDAPPVLESADALIAGKVIPHLLLVVGAGEASLESLDQIRTILDAHGVALIGSVLNKERTYMPRWLYRRLSR